MRSLLTRWLGCGAAIIFLAAASCQASDHPQQQTSVFANGKGVSVAGAVFAARAGAALAYQIQPNRWSPALLARLKASGFGIIRLVTTPAPLMTIDAQAQGQALAHIEKLIDQGNSAGFTVIVDLHFWPTDKPLWQDNVVPDSKLRGELIAAQVALAKRLATRRNRVVLELLNEPPCYVGKVPFDWPSIQRIMVSAVRAVAPRLPLILTGCRGLPKSLTTIDPSPYSGDPNINWTFHYYEPSPFVGQENAELNSVPFPPDPALAASAEKLRAMAPIGTVAARPATLQELRAYLLNNRGQATIANDMAEVERWAKRYAIAPQKIYIGEFGTTMTDTPATRRVRPDELRWILAVRQESERAGFAWSYFPLPEGKSLDYDPSLKFFKADTLKALGLKP